MNIETKTVRNNVEEYLKFGWKHTEDTRVRSGRTSHTEHILARDKDMENYRLIAALEAKYFNLKSQLKTYTPMDVVWNFFIDSTYPFVLFHKITSNILSNKYKLWGSHHRFSKLWIYFH
jgi:hypothetical protein